MQRYKIVNIILFVFSAIFSLCSYYLISSNYCLNGCNLDFKLEVVNPVYAGGYILTGVLAVLLLFPADLFRRWLWYLGGPFLVITLIELSTIPTRGGNIASPTRVGMAELMMQGLVILSVLFIVGYYTWTWYQKREKPTIK